MNFEGIQMVVVLFKQICEFLLEKECLQLSATSKKIQFSTLNVYTTIHIEPNIIDFSRLRFGLSNICYSRIRKLSLSKCRFFWDWPQNLWPQNLQFLYLSEVFISLQHHPLPPSLRHFESKTGIYFSDDFANCTNLQVLDVPSLTLTSAPLSSSLTDLRLHLSLTEIPCICPNILKLTFCSAYMFNFKKDLLFFPNLEYLYVMKGKIAQAVFPRNLQFLTAHVDYTFILPSSLVSFHALNESKLLSLTQCVYNLSTCFYLKQLRISVVNPGILQRLIASLNSLISLVLEVSYPIAERFSFAEVIWPKSLTHLSILHLSVKELNISANELPLNLQYLHWEPTTSSTLNIRKCLYLQTLSVNLMVKFDDFFPENLQLLIWPNFSWLTVCPTLLRLTRNLIFVHTKFQTAVENQVLFQRLKAFSFMKIESDTVLYKKKQLLACCPFLDHFMDLSRNQSLSVHELSMPSQIKHVIWMLEIKNTTMIKQQMNIVDTNELHLEF